MTAAVLVCAQAGPFAVQAGAQAVSPGAPVQLGPPTTIQPAPPVQPVQRDPSNADMPATDRPVPLTPSLGATPAPVPSQGRAEPVPPLPEGPSGIRIGRLDTLDSGSVGVLDADAGGLGLSMWEGTPRNFAKNLVSRLPDGMRSPTGRALAERLLLSTARAPERDHATAAGQNSGPSLLALRLDRLVAMGALDAADRLLRAVPASNDEDAVARIRADVGFLRNDTAKACETVRATDRNSGDPYWRQAQVFCHLLAGDNQIAMIGSGLLEEQGAADPAFFALVRRLTGDSTATVPPVDRPDALYLAMMRAASVELPDGLLESSGPALLRAIALSPNAQLAMRLEAGERGAALGALNAEALGRLYQAVPFSPDEISAALTAADRLPGPQARALLYQSLQAQSVPAAQAEIVSRALALGHAHGRYAITVSAFAPTLATLQPTGDLAWFAGEAGRALYFAGRTDAAEGWRVLATRRSERTVAGYAPGSDDGPRMPEPVRIPADTALWPMAALAAIDLDAPEPAPEAPAGASLPWLDQSSAAVVSVPYGGPGFAPENATPAFDEQAFANWLQALAPLGDAVRHQRAEVLLASFESLGVEVPDSAWRRVLSFDSQMAAMPPMGALESLRKATAGPRLGETVTLALLLLGDKMPADTPPAVLGPVLRALVDAGLPGDARALALEATAGAPFRTRIGVTGGN